MHLRLAFTETPVQHFRFILFFVVVLKYLRALTHYLWNGNTLKIVFCLSTVWLLLLLLLFVSACCYRPATLLQDKNTELFNWKNYLVRIYVLLKVSVEVFLKTDIHHHLLTFFHYAGAVVFLKVRNHTFFIFVRTDFVLQYPYTQEFFVKVEKFIFCRNKVHNCTYMIHQLVYVVFT